MQYRVNDTVMSYEAIGAIERGEDKILVKHAIDLTQDRPWDQQGFTIEKLFPEDFYSHFEKETARLLTSLWKKSGLVVPNNFKLGDYHLLADSNDKHLRAINETRLLETEVFPLGVEHIVERVSEICGVPLIAKNYPYDNQSVFHFRIIRPNTSDNNPLHRDVWLEDYRDCINIYLPIAGSNERSSLIIFPGSHLWPESTISKTTSGASINGVRFNVPAVTEIHGNAQAIRPDPKPNEVLVFSPYLIHGGAVNLNPNQTRISIEMRFWKRN